MRWAGSITVCRLHAVLRDLVPGGFARRISAIQAIQVLDSVTTQGGVATAKLELARELVADLQRIDAQRLAVKRRLANTVAATNTTVTEIHGVGPIIAAAVLGYAGDIRRFASRDHFASYNGTAPIEASSGNHNITDSPAAETGSSTTRSTWLPSSRSETMAPPDGPTTTANEPKA